MLRRWLSAAVVVVFGCSLLNEDRGPKLDCAQNPQARACTNGVLGVCQDGQVAYEICTDEGKFCNVVNGQPVCGTCQPSCDGKSCGPDGCGGVCGTCSTGSTCNAQGACVSGCGTCASDHFCVSAAEDMTATDAFTNTCQKKCFNSNYTSCLGSSNYTVCTNPRANILDCATSTTCASGAGTQDGSSPCR